MGFWPAFWIVAHVAAVSLCLMSISRKRDSLETRVIVKWVLLVVFVPVIGVIGYLFFLLDNVIQRGTPGRQDEAASFLRSPRMKDR